MYYYKATIQYDGTGYHGFQWQNGIPTIQGAINEAIAKILNTKFSTTGASRTDSGVHALKQVIKITSEIPIDCLTFIKEFNSSLPSQIRCLDILPCSWSFRPSLDQISKIYHYYFTNQRVVPSDELRFVSNFSIALDLVAMKACVDKLCGRHDFINFHTQGSNVKSTIREVFYCELIEERNCCFVLKIEGNGFLKQMIRLIVSALWMVGSGKLSVEEFEGLLNGEAKKSKSWKAAPPNGLVLVDIIYPD